MQKEAWGRGCGSVSATNNQTQNRYSCCQVYHQAIQLGSLNLRMHRLMYSRLNAIEQRLQRMLQLLRQSDQSAAALSKALAVSRPTIARSIAALRQRGHQIRARKCGATWCYGLESTVDQSGRRLGVKR
jgi:biotin operon repressor